MVVDYKDARYVSTKRFTYAGEPLEPGQYANPRGATHDRVLFGGESRYFTPAPDGRDREEWKCDRCGRYFVSESHLRGHQRYTAATENTDPEHLAEIRADSAKRKAKELREETLADIARKQGRDVRINERGIPMVQPH